MRRRCLALLLALAEAREFEFVSAERAGSRRSCGGAHYVPGTHSGELHAKALERRQREREEQALLHAQPERHPALLAAVTAAIASGAFRLPSLDEVEAEAARLSAPRPGRAVLSWLEASARQVAEALRPTDTSALSELGRGAVGGH